MLRLLAFIFRWKLIWLRDFENRAYLTRMKQSPFGYKYCYIYPLTGVGFVRLLPNGKCAGSCYIVEWRAYKS